MAAENERAPELKQTLGSKDRLLLRQADCVIGVDEVGRGALAGPVVVCAAAFSSIPNDSEIRDSKLLTPARRREAAVRLVSGGLRYAVCEVWPELIDRLNILECTRIAMRSAAEVLLGPRSVVVTDHVDPGDLGCPVLSPSKADRDFFAVAAASILAKVHRDRIMVELASRHRLWKWESNKGYGTIDHRRGLQEHGPSVIHRRGFRWTPVLP